MERFLLLWQKYKLWILATLAGITLILLFVVVFIKQKAATEQGINPTPSIYPTVPQQKPFQVVSTSPQNGAVQVNTGEIEISFTTDNPIVSADSFSLHIIPSLPYYPKFINSYPTTNVIAQVLGGLELNTVYTVTVKNSSGGIVFSWTFTTSSEIPSSSSRLVEDLENKFIQKYQPLFDVTPFTSPNFNLDYTDKLTLEVTIKKPDVEKVKQEVIDWIKSQGVDPTTHTINYFNDF